MMCLLCRRAYHEKVDVKECVLRDRPRQRQCCCPSLSSGVKILLARRTWWQMLRLPSPSPVTPNLGSGLIIDKQGRLDTDSEQLIGWSLRLATASYRKQRRSSASALPINRPFKIYCPRMSHQTTCSEVPLLECPWGAWPAGRISGFIFFCMTPPWALAHATL